MNRDFDDYMAMGYTVNGTKRADGSWLAMVKELPDCCAVGNTPEEALDNLEAAMGPCIDAANDEAVEALACRLREARKAKASTHETV